ncbi:MAG: PLP-dependent aminotransferase family protein [Burkholderiales bacterium]
MDYSPELGGIIYRVASLARRTGGISFAGGYPDPDLFDADGLAAAYNEVFRDGFRASLQYGDREGYRRLRERIATLCSTAERPVGYEEVIVANGGQQGIATATSVLCRPGDHVFTEAPTFPTALHVFHQAGLKGLGIACDADGMLPDALEAALRRQRPRLLYAVPSYSNPAGALWSLQRRLRVLELAVEYDFHIIEDDPYGLLWFDAPPPPTLLSLAARVPGARERVIHVSSFSKTIAPGLRTGWMIPPAALREQFVHTKLGTDIHSPLPSQYAIDRYIGCGGFAKHLPKIRATYGERARAMHDAILEHLAGRVEWAPPRGGMFFWCKVKSGVDAQTLMSAAEREKVFFVPGIAFYPGDPDRATFRMSFATTPVEGIVEGVRRLGKVIPAA